VVKAVTIVFKNWGSTYFRDLWNRTDGPQRVCLSALKKAGSVDLFSIEQHCSLDRQTVYQAVETLVDRDLVCINERGAYQFAAPIFSEWVERNCSVDKESHS